MNGEALFSVNNLRCLKYHKCPEPMASCQKSGKRRKKEGAKKGKKNMEVRLGRRLFGKEFSEGVGDAKGEWGGCDTVCV